MSEKHLTELPWKTLVTKRQIKDGSLSKALDAYSKADEKDPAAQLKALDTILTSAETVKRGVKDDKEVSSYLDEVLKEARKNRVAAAASAKSAPEEEDNEDAVDAEAEEYKKNYKGKLTAAMSQVKGRAPVTGEDPKPQLRFLALVGAKGGAVLVAANVAGPARKVLKALGAGAGGAFVAGECIFEKNAHTFVVQTVPGGLAKKLSAALRAQSGNSYKVRVRTPDGSVVLDEETDVDPDAPIAGTTPTTETAADPEARWKALKAEMFPGLKAALEANPANRAEILQLVGDATRHEKAGEFTEAGGVFRQLGLVLQGKPATDAGEASASTDTPAPDDKTTFTARLKSIQPAMVAAIVSNTPQGNEIKLRASEVGVLARKQDFPGALQVIGQIEGLLAGATSDPGAETKTKPEVGPGVQFQVSILGWDKAKNQVKVDLSKLEKAILDEFADEPKFAAIKSGLKKLEDVLDGFDERLRDKLDEAYNAPTPDLLPPLREEALEIVDEYLNYVETDGFIAAIDTNPFTPVAISQPLVSTLQEIAGQLRA